MCIGIEYHVWGVFGVGHSLQRWIPLEKSNDGFSTLITT
jgi:hypothetical protein